MSEAYEGVVFRSDETVARSAFGSLRSNLRLRLMWLAGDVFGIQRVAARQEPFDQHAIEQITEAVSSATSRAVALFFDNGCGLRSGTLYVDGRRFRELGDGDAWWVPYGEDGELVLDGPRLRVTELQPDAEYDCVFTAIDAALEAVGAKSDLSAEQVTQAFCYDDAEVLAEKSGPA